METGFQLWLEKLSSVQRSYKSSIPRLRVMIILPISIL